MAAADAVHVRLLPEPGRALEQIARQVFPMGWGSSRRYMAVTLCRSLIPYDACAGTFGDG
ncbi:MAG: hypothetical protein ACLRPT_04175 [Akkermansia muciniphila]